MKKKHSNHKNPSFLWSVPNFSQRIAKVMGHETHDILIFSKLELQHWPALLHAELSHIFNRQLPTSTIFHTSSKCIICSSFRLTDTCDNYSWCLESLFLYWEIGIVVLRSMMWTKRVMQMSMYAQKNIT